MLGGPIFASSRIIHKPYCGKDEYLVRLDASGKPSVEQISGIIETKSPIYANHANKDWAYICYAFESELIGHIFETMPIVNIQRVQFKYSFNMMVKDAELLRTAGEVLPRGNKRTPYTEEIFIDKVVAAAFHIKESQRLLLKNDLLFKPAYR